MFGNFSAYGTVRDIQQETTQSGLAGTSLLIKTGEWQGRDGTNEDFVRVTLWGDKAQMTGGIVQGDAVSVSGFVKSKQNQRGYWNVQLQVTNLVCVAKGQQHVQEQQPAQQYADEDIPF